MITTSKKSLIISTYAPPMIGGPMIIYNLFSQFPKNSYSLMVGYSAIKNQPHNNNYWLAGKYFFYDHPRKTKKDMINEDAGLPPKSQNINQINKKLWSIINFFINKLLLFKRIDILINLLMQTLIVVKRGINIVKKNNIDILIGISGDGLALISTYLIHKFTKKEYIIYLFDLYKGNKFTPSIKLLSNIIEPLIIKNAKKIIVTNQGTKELYLKRYGNLQIEIIYNAIFSDKYEQINTDFKPSSPFKIIFTGHIYWAQEQSVINLIKAIQLIKDIKINLYLYLPKCPEIIKNLSKNYKNVIISKVEPEKIPEIQNQADLLFLPLAWETEAPQIIQTATPGKFTDYLISGRPMLIHAPEYSFISQYVKKNNIGLVVDQNNIKILANEIEKFFKNPNSGLEYVKNAQHIFYDKYTVKANANKLYNLINEL